MIIKFKAKNCSKCPFRIPDYHEDTCVLHVSGLKCTSKASLRIIPEDCPFNNISEITIKKDE